MKNKVYLQYLMWYNNFTQGVRHQICALTTNLILVDEIDINLTFCNINKIHSSIIIMIIKNTFTWWRKQFLEITKQNRSHCRIENSLIYCNIIYVDGGDQEDLNGRVSASFESHWVENKFLLSGMLNFCCDVPIFIHGYSEFLSMLWTQKDVKFS